MTAENLRHYTVQEATDKMMTFSELIGAMPEIGELIEPMEREERIRDAREAIVEAAKVYAHISVPTGIKQYAAHKQLREAVRALEEAEANG